jgi:Outer membrane receptor for ferrienterochelin and colicins
MSLTHTRIRRAVRGALLAGAIASVASVSVYAQETPASGADQEPDVIIVTGSRIRRTDTETASPVQIVTRDEIERTGRQNIAEVIRGIVPADNQGTLPTAFSSGFAAGSAAVSLRGLGVNSTLVLVNGRRMATYGLADDGTRTFVDLNSIPLSAVERVEVLKDGGSAIYGSDAVAGVVNIILRDNFEGFEIGGSMGTSYADDGDTWRVNTAFGTGNDKYNVFVVAEASREEAIFHTNRTGFLGTNNLRDYGWFDNRRGAVPFAGFGFFEPGVPAFSAVTPYGSVRVPGGDITDRVNLLDCPEISGDTGLCLYDTIGYSQIQPQVERLNILTRGTYNFTDTLQGYVELGYFNSEVYSIGTPGSVNDSGVFNPADPASPIVHTTILPAGHPDNPFAEDRTLSLLTTMLGGRNGRQETDLYRAIAGITGEINSNWEWDVGIGYIKSKLTDTNYGFIRHPVLQAALDSGEFRIDPSLNSPELLAEISPALTRKPESSIKLIDARISGELFDLPGGRFGVAVGAEYREEKNDTPPVPYTDTGDIVGLGYSGFSADRDVYAGYVEVNAPVHEMLELNAALRYDHYSDYGDSTTPKVGFKFQPVQQFALRGTYQEAFRAPGPAEAGNSSSFGFTNIGILTIGNPNLKPEEAKAYTAGIIWEPLRDLNVSIDYYRIKRENEIVAADQALVIGDLPVRGEPNSQIPGLLPNSFLYYDTEGELATISAPFVNANKTNTDGIDFDLRYAMDLGPGRLSAGLVWTHVLNYERQLPGGEEYEYVGTHGPYVLSSASGTPQDRGRLELTWSSGPLSLTAAVNYVSSMEAIDHKGETLVDLEDGSWATTTFEGAYVVADPNGKVCGVYNPDGTVWNNCKVDSFTTVDFYGTYHATDSLEFNLSISNLLNKEPPFDPYTYGGVNYNPSFHQAGAVGRFFTVGFRYSYGGR